MIGFLVTLLISIGFLCLGLLIGVTLLSVFFEVLVWALEWLRNR